jgi:hypothetical protein
MSHAQLAALRTLRREIGAVLEARKPDVILYGKADHCDLGFSDWLSDPKTVAMHGAFGVKEYDLENPPYSYKPGIADKFVGQALKFTRMQGGKIAMLLNLGSLAHRTRTSKWRNDPPARIHIMDDVTCFPNGNPHQAGRFITEHRYCWVVWEHQRSVGTQLTWLRMAEFRGQGGRS